MLHLALLLFRLPFQQDGGDPVLPEVPLQTQTIDVSTLGAQAPTQPTGSSSSSVTRGPRRRIEPILPKSNLNRLQARIDSLVAAFLIRSSSTLLGRRSPTMASTSTNSAPPTSRARCSRR